MKHIIYVHIYNLFKPQHTSLLHIHLVMRLVPPNNNHKDNGAWHLAARGFHQAVYNWISPSGSRATPGNTVEAELLYALNLCGLQGFGWYLKDRLAGVFLEL